MKGGACFGHLVNWQVLAMAGVPSRRPLDAIMRHFSDSRHCWRIEMIAAIVVCFLMLVVVSGYRRRSAGGVCTVNNQLPGTKYSHTTTSGMARTIHFTSRQVQEKSLLWWPAISLLPPLLPHTTVHDTLQKWNQQESCGYQHVKMICEGLEKIINGRCQSRRQIKDVVGIVWHV